MFDDDAVYMDFVGGNEIRIERVCSEECSDLSPDIVIENLKSIGADGGVIVLDSEGNAAMTFNTPAMARAYKNSKGEQLVKIYKD